MGYASLLGIASMEARKDKDRKIRRNLYGLKGVGISMMLGFSLMVPPKNKKKKVEIQINPQTAFAVI